MTTIPSRSHIGTKPRQLEALAFYLGAHGIDPTPVMQEIEERFTQETSEEKQESLRTLRELEAKRERVQRERPEAEATWTRIRKELGDTKPLMFQAVLMTVFAALALLLDTMFLAPTMDILNIANPALQFLAAAGFAALCTACFDFVGIQFQNAGNSFHKRMTAIAMAGMVSLCLIAWGLLRGYELRFAAGLAGNPLGQFLADHSFLAAVFYIFITLATPVIGAMALLNAWNEVSAALTWQRVCERFEQLRATEIELGRQVQSTTEALDHFDLRKEAACREWKAIFAQFYDRGARHGARKEALLLVVGKSALGGACAAPLAFLVPSLLVPALVALPVVAGLGLFAFFDRRRNHPSHNRYLAQENTQFAVDPDAPTPRMIRAHEPRLLPKGDQ